MTPNYTEGGDPVIDTSIWQTAFHRIGGVFASVLNAWNEFMLSIQARIAPSNSPVSYEKTALIVEVEQSDPSDYESGITRDGCAFDARSYVAAGNPSGRAWAAYAEAGVRPNADGLAVCQEFMFNNHGSDQPQVDTVTSKYMAQFIAGLEPGAKGVTCGLYFIPQFAYFHHVLFARTDAFEKRDGTFGNFLTLCRKHTNTPITAIHGDGSLTFFGRSVQPKTVTLKDGSELTVLTLA